MGAPTSRRPASVVVALGSNIDPERHLAEALARLAERLAVRATSAFRASDPVGAPGTPRFLNAAVLAETDLDPHALKYEVLRPIEAALGRVRGDDRNAPRTIDLDIVLYGDLVLDDAEHGLRIPDPDLLRHAHVAGPAAEVAPERLHPQTGERLADIAARLAASADG